MKCGSITNSVLFPGGSRRSYRHRLSMTIFPVFTSAAIALHLKNLMICSQLREIQQAQRFIHMQMHMLRRTDAKITCQLFIIETGLSMSEISSKTICSIHLTAKADDPPLKLPPLPDSACLSCMSAVEQMGGTISVKANSVKAAGFTVYCLLNSV